MKETKFKQTEVGMIPSDWEVKTVGKLLKIGHGKDYKNLKSGTVPVYGTGGYMTSVDKYLYDGETVCIGRKGTIDKPFYHIGKIWTVDTLFYTFGFNGCIPKFIYYAFGLVDWLGMNEASGVPSLTSKNIEDVLLRIPPTIEEQQRIANALSDVDTLINNLEKLIAKKKNIKQGAMQQLLTGKKRLPGFGSDERQKECHSERSAKREVEESSGYKMTELGMIPTDWEVKPIKELGLFLGGGTPSTKNESFWKGNIPWISSADLNDDDIEHISMTRFITQEAVNFSATQICPQGTILIIARVGVGKLALSQQKVCTSQDFCNLIPSKENDSKFLAYALLPVMKRMSNESQGTSIKGVAVDEIKKVQIIVPSSKAEQTAIANVLSDMDTEIATLETKLAKYRTLKTGMMQQLLTGKVRLV